MDRHFQLVVSVLVVLTLATDTTLAVDFQSEIEPILRTHCIDCHGPDEQNSQLRLDRLASMLAGGDSGEPAIVRGNPAASHLLRLIKREEAGREMPPDEALSETNIQLIEKWIAEGAPTPDSYGPATAAVELDHWSFQPIQRPAKSDSIDGFIQAKLREHGLQPSDEADRRVLIRRLYLVMLGIPPSPDEVEQFVNDDRDDAWTRIVEQILASPHYGQRWASHWLDLVRFGETDGFETNRERPNAWPYRDWVIESFNQDKPYDQFVREQLAGDALGVDIGTSFLVAGPRDIVKGQDPLLGQVQRMNELDDMINTTGTAFLGLTTGCARCHNHKFDPISQRDYYSLQAIFAGVNHGDRSLPISRETKEQIESLDQEISELQRKLERFRRVETIASKALDESAATFAFEPAGTGTKANVDEDPGFGGKQYTWWQLRPHQDHVTYRPKLRGRYRVWLSWGAGFATHCSDARYVIRSKDGEQEIAQVNQQLPATGGDEIPRVPRWSGFFDAGVHALEPDDELVLVGGAHGTALTADAVVFQPEQACERIDRCPPPTRRDAVVPTINVEQFPPREVQFVRFIIERTNGAQACIDELEIFSEGKNVALAETGAKATSSGDFQHPLHKLAHINDGQYGNPRSWIVDSNQGGWVQIELPKPTTIDQIAWGRDRLKEYNDRLAIEYRIETALRPNEWESLVSSADRRPYGETKIETELYSFDGLPQSDADQGRQWLEEWKSARDRKRELEQSTPVYAGIFSQPGPTHRLYRGEPNAKREPVGPDTIRAFDSLDLANDAPEQQRRLALANWIASSDNPLTARVIVNRLWQFHFGVGLVDTPSDFGTNGVPPTHPQLLDWLASELIDNGWSLKHVHRLILHSQTWRQSGQPRPDAMRVDASSRLWWRFPPRRAEAEVLRDSILSVAGTLEADRSGGPGFSAFEVQMENVRHYHPKQDFGPEDWRRMVYMTKVRQEKDQVFGVFDCPDASMVVPKRSRSTTPLQALNLLNSRFVLQQAEMFADRLRGESDTVNEQIRRAWELCFSRPPTEAELADSEAFIDQQGLAAFTRALLNANEFLFIP